ncbi:MAG TPA: transglycosylase domain-containing protein [Candidatus Saccharimonadales bacterium]|nr:transglycosylase domain-containing protein [Candidatus Saccharimonadales bacterium]
MPKRPNRGGKPILTRSGRAIKVNRSLGERFVAMREAKAVRRLNRMRGLPKSRVKRILWRLHPKRLADYWFSRDGAIMALKVLGIAILALFVITLGVFAYFRKDLPDIKDISGSSLGGSISYYDRTGNTLLWQDYDAVKRVPVQSQDISNYLKQATVAVEDKDFYNHRGFDVRGVARAGLQDVVHRGAVQGGSTITEQLVKLNLDWSQSRTITRKVKELIIAVELERNYTKDEILTGYLNAAPYGSIDYGAQVAANDYFHKNAKDLTLPEAAMLAAIPNSPAVYSPYNKDFFNKKAFLDRYNYVLDQMQAQGKITKKQASDAKKTDVLAEVQPQQTKYAGIQAPYFVLAARDEIINKYAPKGPGSNKIGGWKVITTLDLNLQQKAEQLVASNRSSVERYGGDEEALVAEDVQTGQMAALVGGVDFTDPDHGEINYAHEAFISPGSSFKPYDYSTLIDNNSVGGGSVLYDNEGSIPGYPCTIKGSPPPKGNSNCLYDYDFNFPGPVSIRYGLAGSRNVPAVKAMLEAKPNDTSPERIDSVNKVITTANSMMAVPGAYRCYKPGTDVTQATKADEDQCHGASAIGDGAYLHLDQHVNGVATLARLGKAIPATYILKIYDSKSSTKPFYEWHQPKDGETGVKQVINPQTAFIVDSMLSDPNASYLVGNYYKYQHYNGWNISVKTGTTGASTDGLMMAWSTKYAVGSWVGYHTRTHALTTFMETMTTPLTKGLITYALDSLHTTPENWNEPPGIQHLPAFVVSHKISKNGEVVPSPSTDIFPSWYKQKSGNNQNVTIDKVSGKIATNCTPDLAKQTQGGNAAPNAFSVDVFYPPGGSSNPSGQNASGSDDVHNCSDSPPTIQITAPDSCDGSCTISATAFAGTHPLNDSNYSQFPGTITISINGNQICQSTTISDGVPLQCDYTSTISGSGTVTATVTDSVLYQGTSQATVNFSTQQSNPISLDTPAVTGNGANKKTNFSWSGGTGPYTVHKSDGTTLCTSNDQKCSVAFTQAPSGTQVYVQDANGTKSNNATVP